MPEAIMVLLDNSDYSINGDYIPTRWVSQIDSAGLMIQSRMEHDHQVHIGLGLMAGKQTQIVCTPTNDSGKVTAYLYGVKQSGLINFCQSLQIASLALKHRQDHTLRQRIIIFVASTIRDSIEQIKIIGKKLRKNNIAINVIVLGDTSNQQKEKTTALVEAANHDNNSSLKVVEPGPRCLSDQLVGSDVMGGHMAGEAMVNEQEDPEFLMALRLSLQQANGHNISQQPAQRAQRQVLETEQDELERKAFELSIQDKPQSPNNNNKDKDKDPDPDNTMKEQ